jgi:hypothetical protein
VVVSLQAFAMHAVKFGKKSLEVHWQMKLVDPQLEALAALSRHSVGIDQ